MGPEFLFTVCIAASIGVIIGAFTGMVPGIHVNTAASILLSSYPVMAASLSGLVGEDYIPILVACCIFAASTVHSFVDFVPSVFIGAPDPDEALSILPGHLLLSRGLGMRAVRAAAVGSIVGAVAATILAVPMQWIMLAGASAVLDRMTFGVLIVALTAIVLSSKRKVPAALLIALSSITGYIVENGGIPCTGLLGEGTLLFPMLTGFFGIPPLLETVSGKRMPRQRDEGLDPVGPLPGLKGVLTGIAAGWFPGITATVGATIAAAFGRERAPESFISMTASIGTVTSVFALVTLSVTGSGRSGTAQAVKEIIGDALSGFCSEAFLAILFSIAAASALGYAATICAGKAMMHVVDGIPENTLSNAVLILVTTLVFLMTGPYGLTVLCICTVIGMLPPVLGASRVTLAACLITPSLILQLETLGIVARCR